MTAPPSGGPGGRTRVLWVSKTLNRGGAEQLLVEHARRGDHDRFDYHAAFLLGDKDALVEELRSAGVTVHAPSPDRPWPTWLVRQVRTLRPAVVHVHSPLPASLLRLVPGLPPTVATEHNRWAAHHRATRMANALTFGRDAHHFAVSADVAAGVTPRHRAAVEVLQHGIDVAAAAARGAGGADRRRDLGVPDDDLLVVTVANPAPKKDLPTLLQAAQRVVAARDDVWFVHVGDGPDLADLRALHRQLGLGERFRFLGPRSDAVELLAAGDVCCLSSRHEGLPVSVMEAFAVGTPVVATADGGLAEAVTPERDGVLVTPGAPDELAAALVALAADPDRRQRLAAGAAAGAVRFDADQAVARIEQIYVQVASGT